MHWHHGARRDGALSMFAIVLIVLGVVIYMASPGIFHNTAKMAVNTVFDALSAATGNKTQRPFGGSGLERPPQPPGTATTPASKSDRQRAEQARARAQAKARAARKQASRTP